MEIQAATPPKKAKYRIAEFVENIPFGRIMEEKEALASQLGISLHQLNRIIRGGSDPSGSQLLIIAKYFGVAVDELYQVDETAIAA